jgi:hypothetical protein
MEYLDIDLTTYGALRKLYAHVLETGDYPSKFLDILSQRANSVNEDCELCSVTMIDVVESDGNGGGEVVYSEHYIPLDVDETQRTVTFNKKVYVLEEVMNLNVDGNEEPSGVVTIGCEVRN